MIAALAVLFACHLMGDLLARLLALPIPGPVLGLVLLLAWLAWGRGLPTALPEVATGLLRHLSLLFVPAGVGILVHLDRITTAAVPLALALVGSTLLAMVATAVTFRWVAHLVGCASEPDDTDGRSTCAPSCTPGTGDAP